MVEVKTTYVAVGFRVDKSNSVFYIKEADITRFFEKVRNAVVDKDPHFVSLRIVRTI